MRSVLISGLSLALGMTVSPALAQDNRPPVRAARLGSPVAVASPAIQPTAIPIDGVVTPVGLLAAGQDGSPIPTPMPMPMQPGGIPMPGVNPLPPPTPVPMPPSVTEQRNPSAGGTPGFPSSFPAYPPLEGAYIQPGAPAYVTGPLPGTVYPDGAYPPDCLQQPGNDCDPQIPAVDRVKSCGRSYVSAEYLMWWTRSMQVPSLLTTSSPADFGIPGVGNTRSIYGGDIGNTFHSGGRFDIGHWFGCESVWGLEGRFFFLDPSDSSFLATSNQYPVLARPFTNVNRPVGPFSELIAYPGLATGAALIKTQTTLWGAEANVRRVLFGTADGPGFELDILAGYRFIDLNDHLSIEESFVRTPGSNMAIGTPAISGSVIDQFHTTNMFNGGQIGLNASYQYGKWFIQSRSTVAFGDLEQIASINGGQTLNFANGTVGKYVGGLLALPGANIGVFNHSQFAVIPETTVNLGYQLTSHTRLFIGYDFLFLGNALRPGGTIDTSIDAARIPNFPLPGSPAPLAGAPRPGPYFATSNFFAQGINFGAEFRW